MGYLRSPYGSGAPLLRGPHARSMAVQIFGGPEVSCKETSSKGAFLTSRAGFGEVLLIDINILDPGQRNSLKSAGYTYKAKIDVDVSKDEIIGFSSPHSSRRERRRTYVGPSYRSHLVPVLEIKDANWCLAALHAGILPKGRTQQEALATYDEQIATSAHERLAMRKALAERPQ